MKTLIVTVKGDYARFRCSHTTTSALTYLVMHPLAVKGLIGAVMGIDYKELFEYTKDMKVAVQVLNPVYKDMQSFNLMPQSGGNGSPRFQSRIEFLRDVKYRIFVSCDEEKLNSIAESLKSHEYVFTPYLGCSEHIAKVEFEAVEDSKALKEEKILLDTVFPAQYLSIGDEDEFKLYIDRIPVKNDKNREYIQYDKVIFSTEKKLLVENCEAYKVGEYNVYYL